MSGVELRKETLHGTVTNTVYGAPISVINHIVILRLVISTFSYGLDR